MDLLSNLMRLLPDRASFIASEAGHICQKIGNCEQQTLQDLLFPLLIEKFTLANPGPTQQLVTRPTKPQHVELTKELSNVMVAEVIPLVLEYLGAEPTASVKAYQALQNRPDAKSSMPAPSIATIFTPESEPDESSHSDLIPTELRGMFLSIQRELAQRTRDLKRSTEQEATDIDVSEPPMEAPQPSLSYTH